MSENIGETFVSIVPIVNEAQFAAQVESQVAAATANVKAEVAVTPISTQAAEQRIASLKGITQDLENLTAGVGQRVAVSAATTETAAIALDGYTTAAVAAAKAEVELDIALGRTSSAENLALLQRARLTEQTERLGLAEQRRGRRGPQELTGVIRGVSSGELPVSSLLAPASILRFGAAGLAIGAVVSTLGALEKALKVDGDEALTTEGRFRNLGAALLSGNVVEGFKALTVHSTSAATQLKELSKGLNLEEAVSGAEQMQQFVEKTAAARAEVTAAIAKIGEEKNTFDLQTASTRALGTATIDLLGPVGDLAEKYGLADIATRRLADGDTALSRALKEQLEDLDKTGAKAREYAHDLKVAEDAVKDLAIAQLTSARNASLVSRTEGLGDDLAEARRQEARARERLADPDLPLRKDNPKRIAAENAVVEAHSEVLRLRKQLAEEQQSLQSTIESNRTASEESITSRTDSSSDDLALARKELAKAQADFKAGADTALERSKLNRAVVEAKTKVVKLEKSLAAEGKAAADAARQAREDELAAQKREADLRGKALRDALDVREQQLQLNLQDAQNTTNTIADDRRALLALIQFNKAKSTNMRLERSERLSALAEEKSLRTDLNNLNKDRLALALGVREQNLRNAIEAAKLTSRTDDDEKANNAFLAFLKRQVVLARKLKDGGQALADAKGDLIAFQLSLKGASSAGGGFSVQDLFQEAVKEFRDFGSNISTDGLLSPQDARGKFAQSILTGNNEEKQRARIGAFPEGDFFRPARESGGQGVQGAQLTQLEQQTLLLQEIAAGMRGGVVQQGGSVRPARESGGKGSTRGVNSVTAGAANGY